MSIRYVTVAGGGVLGSQIAFQTAFRGFEVTIYEINDEAVAKAKDRIANLQKVYAGYFANEAEQVNEAYQNRIQFSKDLTEAVKQADLVIEAIPERVDIKQDFYSKLSQVASARTIFASNSSSFLPSQFANTTGRPDKFIALHFANQIWKNNIAEIMPHKGTAPEVTETILGFAKSIGMVPIHLKKEQPGYVLNTLLIPFLNAGQYLWSQDIAEPHTIDKTWMISTGAPLGPFAILDVVGLNTVYNILMNSAQKNDSKEAQLAGFMASRLKTEYIDQGKLGIESGEGFYQYPNPAYLSPSFLKA